VPGQAAQAPSGGGVEPAIPWAHRRPLARCRKPILPKDCSLDRQQTQYDFSGSLPTNLSSCTSLMVMHLRFSQISGSVPSEFGNKLMRLRTLTLTNNSLTGSIPASLGNLSSLGVLELSFNQLEGTIPHNLGILKNLWFLGLAHNNLLGNLPISLYVGVRTSRSNTY